MIDINSDVLKKLSQVGYMASMRGYAQKGELIMEGIQCARPEQVPVLLGLAISKIAANKYEDARTIIEDNILESEPENMTAKTFLGIALFEMGENTYAQSYFDEVLSHGDEDQKQIALIYSKYQK